MSPMIHIQYIHLCLLNIVCDLLGFLYWKVKFDKCSIVDGKLCLETTIQFFTSNESCYPENDFL